MPVKTVAAADRTLPHDLEAEKSVLGAVLVDEKAWPVVAALLEADDFYRDAHRRIYLALQQLAHASMTPDHLTLASALRTSGELDDVGGPAYVGSLGDGMPRAVNVKYYCAIVREKAQLRAAIYAANKVLGMAYDQEPLAEVAEVGVRAFIGIGTPIETETVTLGRAVGDYAASLDETGTGRRFYPLGLTDVDDIAGGAQRKCLTLIAARPSVGKTSLLLDMLMHNAPQVAARGEAVALISIETDAYALGEAALAKAARIDAHRLRARALGDKDYERMSQAMEAMHTWPFHIVQAAKTIGQVCAWARRLRDEHNVRLLGIDYFQLLVDMRARDFQREAAMMSRALTQEVAVEMDMAVVACSQLSRAVEGRRDKRPQLSDLRETGQLEQDAHLVLLLYRDDMYNTRPDNEEAGTAEVIVAKNRSGPSGVARVAFLREQTRFANLAQGNIPY